MWSRRAPFAIALLPAVACVDLFHATDFETLCSRDPASEACNPAASDGGGHDAPYPRLDFCAAGALETRTRAQRACAWLGACEGPLGWTKLGTCIHEAMLAYDCFVNPSHRPRARVEDFWQCLASAAACADVDRCLFSGETPACGSFPVEGSFTTCAASPDGDVRVECSGGPRPTGIEPCFGRAQTCTALDESTATCTGLAGKDCARGERCEGTSLVRCAGAPLALDEGVDCSGYGDGRCVAATTGAPRCAPVATSPPCAGGSLLCAGAIASECIDGLAAKADCARLGTSCAPRDGFGPVASCFDRDDAGAPRCVAEDVCEGNVVRSCGAHAEPLRIDCTAVGLGPCSLRANGHAACNPPPP